MMNKNYDYDKLSKKFGTNFQNKAISALCKDSTFFDRVADILKPEFFDGESRQWIVEKAIHFHTKYKDSPTLDYFHEEVQSISSDSLNASVTNNLKRIWKNRKSPDLDYVKENFLEFCKNQEVKRAMKESADLLQIGEYEKIRKRFDEALSAGMRKDVGHDYMEQIDDRMEEAPRDTVPTGWPVLDGEVLDGGLAPGEIGVFMGATGAGKCVGKDAEVEIEYEQVGIEADGITAWFDPWEKIETSEGELTAWEIGKILEEEDIEL